MCGISGLLNINGSASPDELADVCTRMRDSLTHRGPDSAGNWVDADARVALGHRRLSVIDLSAEGHQPMVSASERFVLVYNGEIYNYRELRDELIRRGHRFCGHSDTEVLLESIDQWGLRETLRQINGMFAFALWDRRDRKLTLVRDRLGIKPLYYGWAGTDFLFASELKAFKQHPQFRPEIDRNVLALFLENGYVPSPCCIYRDVQKLQPGHLLELSLATGSASPSLECYWSLRDVVQKSKGVKAWRDEEWLESLAERIRDAVRLRLIADVPVGTFLSGGIDSSLIVSQANLLSEGRIKSFTIGFESPDYDESAFAKAVADHLGVEQVTQIVRPREALDTIPLLPAIYDEPFADSSQIPTYLVSKLARQEVTVCLSGDGGDELFGGYHRYNHINRIRNKLAWLPYHLRKSLLSGYSLLRNQWLRKRTEPGLAALLASAKTDQEFYALLNRHWKHGSQVVVNGAAEATAFQPAQLWTDLGTFIESMMAYDCATYLPEDILCKVDRASMAHALEVRVPLLDYRVVEFAWALPAQYKFAKGQGKLPLRRLVSRSLPAELFQRKKTGFGIPIGEWLKGPLREWAEDLLSAERLQREGWFDPEPIRIKWQEHLEGRFDWQYLLWNVLTFQAWNQADP